MSKSNEAAEVKSELSELSSERFTELRDAYYGVADHLPALAESLELADLDRGGKADELLNLHFAALEMMDAFKKLDALGKHL